MTLYVSKSCLALSMLSCDGIVLAAFFLLVVEAASVDDDDNISASAKVGKNLFISETWRMD